ncbi:MAG: TatD family hydrolase [Gallicola sp.]|uniref:TatD family hydrolase n=1 Tax=Gallicola sp. Sow4_E12 TaxID=3438785 RepID=UPI00183C852E|nr:TatD family hydrolase [Gallicola sp.]
MKYLYDSHAHLDDDRFDQDREDIIKSLKSNGISLVINPGADMKSSRKAMELADRYPNIFAGVGIHPQDASHYQEEDLEILRKWSEDPKVVAIGEIGLDYYYGKDNKEEQIKLFREQMKLASEMSLPVLIHMRDATEDTYNILKEYEGKVRGIMHCYSGSVEMAELFMNLGYYISLAGVVTFKNAKAAKDVAKKIPLERLLIETDSPYLTPEPNRGKRNEPKYVKHVADKICELRGISLVELSDATRRNTEELFGLQGVELD